MGADVLLVSLGATAGLRAADEELAGALRRAGAAVEVVTARRPAEVRTYALPDLTWARAARARAREGLAAHPGAAVVYSSTTAALLGPRRGAIRFDALAAANRPGRHGLWQRPVERRRLAAAALLLPWSEDALAAVPAASRGRAVVVPVPVAPSGPPAPERDLAAITYASGHPKKALGSALEAWERARRPGEELVVAGVEGADRPGVRFAGLLPREGYRALVRRARVFVSAPEHDEYGIAQLEALADGCVLVSTRSARFVARRLAEELDPRAVAPDLAAAIRAGLDEPVPGYAARAAELLEPWRPERVDALVAERVLPRLA